MISATALAVPPASTELLPATLTVDGALSVGETILFAVVVLVGLIPWNIAMDVPLKTIDVGIVSGFFAFYLYFLPLWNLVLGIAEERKMLI